MFHHPLDSTPFTLYYLTVLALVSSPLDHGNLRRVSSGPGGHWSPPGVNTHSHFASWNLKNAGNIHPQISRFNIALIGGAGFYVSERTNEKARYNGGNVTLC